MGKRPEVVFYYPQLFNRTKNGTNPYFEPLIKLCKENKISYLVFEEPATEDKYPADKNSTKFDALFWFIIILHKIFTKLGHYSLHESDRKIGRILDFLTFHKLRAVTYITISNSMIDVLGELNPNGNVYDLQHGIIYNGHWGYFSNKDILRPTFLLRNRRVLLWGNIYKQFMSNLSCSYIPEDKFIVIGYPMYQQLNILQTEKEKVILVSLQFTSDISSKLTDDILDMLDEFVSIATANGYKILLKHHPRFSGEVNLNPLIQKYVGLIDVTDAPLTELAKIIKLQMTWGSTTTMEFAAYGIPTFFLRDNRCDWATDMFYEQYHYPLYDGMSTSQVLSRIDCEQSYRNDCHAVKNWYESAYAPFNDELMVKILKGEINEK